MSTRTATSGLLLVALTMGLASSAYAQRIAFARGFPRSLLVGKTARVTATVRGLANTAVVYTSSDTTIARVSSTGTVTALRPGTVTITAISVGDTSLRTPPLPFPVVQPRNVNLLINEVCPNQDSSFFRGSLPVTADLPYIHEFHDCQRLIASGGYRALIGIFAHAHVDTFPPAFFRGGRLAAVIINFRTKRDTIPYAELDLRPGTNCLILNWLPDRRLWQAAIIHQPTPLTPAASGQYADCPDTLRWDDVPAARKGRLTVQLQTRAVGPDDKPGVPPVARWDWDRRRGHNYVGIKCGRVWCEIGPPGFTPSVALKTETNRNIVKGYYDEQYLADTSGKLSRVFGTVRPSTDTVRRDGGWHHAAEIRIHISPADYVSDRSVFDFYVKEYRLSSVLPLHSATGDVWMMADEGSTGDYGLLINGHMGPRWRMKFHHHPGYENRAGTVRWRWDEKDERIWRYCEPEGCCESKTTTLQ